MWFLLTFQMYKLGMMSGQEAIRNLDEDINERAKTGVVNITICSQMYSDIIQNMDRSYSTLPVHQVRTIG